MPYNRAGSRVRVCSATAPMVGETTVMAGGEDPGCRAGRGELSEIQMKKVMSSQMS
jgi:hypothetical protein